MHAEDSFLNEGGEGDVVENLGAISPHINRAVFPETFVVEAIDLRDLSTFVVASDERDAVRVSDFEGEQQQEGLHRVEATVHEVPHEEVVGLGALATHFKQLDQVVELPVDVPTNL